VPFLRFSPKGQELFDDWRQELENKIRTGDEHPALEAHLSKYRSLMPSLALVFHVIAVVGGREEVSVSEDAAKIAAAWCDCLELHARRIYQGFIQQDISIANLLARRIKKGQLPVPFTVRQVYRKGWTGLSDAGEIEKGAAILEELGWLRSDPITTGESGGRPTVEYHVNPRLNGKGA
jgi:putative DNA primase/helicase